MSLRFTVGIGCPQTAGREAFLVRSCIAQFRLCMDKRFDASQDDLFRKSHVIHMLTKI